MPSRRDARRRALDILYQADVTGVSPDEVVAEWEASGRELSDFTRELVAGVEAHRTELDRLIGEHAEGWTVPRLASVDRSILRLACLELAYRDDVPTSVAISEAVEAAKELSTEDSSRFVNGILGNIAREATQSEP